LGVEESMMEERLKQMQESLFGRRSGGQGEDARISGKKFGHGGIFCWFRSFGWAQGVLWRL
ncbi:unnamed protein product, partial [Symbiodinium pilosum]